LLLLLATIGLAAAGIFFFRHHENELEQRAEPAFRGLGCNDASDCCDLTIEQET
jgi:hypothetical protein